MLVRQRDTFEMFFRPQTIHVFSSYQFCMKFRNISITSRTIKKLINIWQRGSVLDFLRCNETYSSSEVVCVKHWQNPLFIFIIEIAHPFLHPVVHLTVYCPFHIPKSKGRVYIEYISNGVDFTDFLFSKAEVRIQFYKELFHASQEKWHRFRTALPTLSLSSFQKNIQRENLPYTIRNNYKQLQFLFVWFLIQSPLEPRTRHSDTIFQPRFVVKPKPRGYSLSHKQCSPSHCEMYILM